MNAPKLCVLTYSGGPSAYWFGQFRAQLQALLNALPGFQNFDGISQIFLLVEVGGEVSNNVREGVFGVRLNRKGGLECRIGFPYDSWRGLDPIELRKLYASSIQSAVRLLMQRVGKSGIAFDVEGFEHDFQLVLEAFLEMDGPFQPTKGQLAIRDAFLAFARNRRLRLALGDNDVPELGEGARKFLEACEQAGG